MYLTTEQPTSVGGHLVEVGTTCHIHVVPKLVNVDGGDKFELLLCDSFSSKHFLYVPCEAITRS